MTKFLEYLPLQPRQSAASSLFRMLVVVFLGFFVAQFIAALTVLPLLEFSLSNLEAVSQDPTAHPNGRLALLVLQAVSTLLAFIVFPLLSLRVFEEQGPRDVSPNWQIPLQDIPLLLIILYTFLVVDARIIVWNQNIELPGTLEMWARNLEDQAAQATEALTQMNTTGDLIFVMLIVAVLPGIAEEFLFRGIIQNYLLRWTKNPHLSIWVAAILFSAIHLQFYGFVPRMLLGGLFGYLFYWSGSLSVAMFAHFLNNAVSLLFVYLARQEVLDAPTDTPEMLPWPATVGALLVFAVLISLYRYYKVEYKPQYG